MSLLGNLVSQVARSAMDPNDAQRNPINQRTSPRRTGGLGDILGSVLGGSAGGYNPQQYGRQADNGFGLDDLLGGLGGGAQRGGGEGRGDGRVETVRAQVDEHGRHQVGEQTHA